MTKFEIGDPVKIVSGILEGKAGKISSISPYSENYKVLLDHEKDPEYTRQKVQRGWYSPDDLVSGKKKSLRARKKKAVA